MMATPRIPWEHGHLSMVLLLPCSRLIARQNAGALQSRQQYFLAIGNLTLKGLL